MAFDHECQALRQGYTLVFYIVKIKSTKPKQGVTP
jgi:hypothetical protein